MNLAYLLAAFGLGTLAGASAAWAYLRVTRPAPPADADPVAAHILGADLLPAVHGRTAPYGCGPGGVVWEDTPASAAYLDAVLQQQAASDRARADAYLAIPAIWTKRARTAYVRKETP